MYAKILKVAAGLCALSLVMLSSCKKPEKYAEMVNDQPFVVLGPVGMVPYNLPNYTGYKTSYMIGDTAVLIGKFFLDRPGSQIMIGSEPIKISYSMQIKDVINPANQYTHQPNQMDYIRFPITSAMGPGNKIPLTIKANGVTIQAPAIDIRKFSGALARTDTTLVVDSVTRWRPDNYSWYQQNYIPLVQDINVTGDGTICFNNAEAVYISNGGTTTKIVKAGDSFMDKGASFNIKMFIGSTLSYAGDTLSFSAEVMENSSDTANNYIYRLCKYSLATKSLTTINRTLLQKGTATANAVPGPFEGNPAQIPLIAVNLRTDTKGNVYFVNHYAYPRTDFNGTTLHNGGIWQSVGGPYTGILNSAVIYKQTLKNICRIDQNGSLASLVSCVRPAYYGAPLYSVPGFPAPYTRDFSISQDGTKGYIIDNYSNQGDISLGELNLQTREENLSTGYRPKYLFYSYDFSRTGLPNGSDFQVNSYNINLNNWLPLPNGNILLQYATSVAALDLQNQTAYCYAGTEAGFYNYGVTGQVYTTGKAKWVKFQSYANYFAGMDKTGAIYFCYITQNYVDGLVFYKMYPKK